MTVGVYEAVGMQYYEKTFEALAEKNEDFDRTDASLLKEYEEGDKIYKYLYPVGGYTVEPEPGNKYDENAIVIKCAGQTIGYIKREQTEKVRELMAAGYDWRVYVEGGELKLIEDEEVLEDELPMQVMLFFYEHEELPQPKNRRAAMQIFLMIVGALLVVMGLILLLAVPVAGVVAIILGVLFFLLGRGGKK